MPIDPVLAAIIGMIVVLVGYYAYLKVSAKEQEIYSLSPEDCLTLHLQEWEFEENEWIDNKHRAIYFCPICEDFRVNTIPVK